MRKIISILLPFWIVTGSVITPVQAQTLEGQTRCLLLGPLIISGYIELFNQVSQKKRDQIGARTGQVVDLIDLYDRLGCSTQELTKAVECLSTTMLDRTSTVPIAPRAQTCMRKSGMQVQ